MINRRSFLAFTSVLVLAACSNPTQVVDAATASGISVAEVTASTTVSRTDTAIPKAQVVETARAKVASALGRANPNGARALRAEVRITQFYIANPVAGALLGSSSSSINTEVSLIDIATGETVKEPFRVSGITEPRPTIFGAAAIKAPEEELDIITDDLARRVRIAIYGN